MKETNRNISTEIVECGWETLPSKKKAHWTKMEQNSDQKK